MACLITGGGVLSKCSKTNNDANPTNYMFSFILVKPVFILVKHVACLYTLSTWLNMTLYSAQVFYLQLKATVMCHLIF